MELEDLTERERLALFGTAELIFTNMQNPPETKWPSPDNTRKWIINGLIAVYLAGRNGDISKIMPEQSPSVN